jgi:DnaA family protein
LKQLPLALRDGPAPDFDNFIPGSNAEAFETMQRMAASLESGYGHAPSDMAALVYLWGPPGSGKTHLLRALAAAHESQGGRVGWFTPRDRTPWAYDEAWSLVVLDDCDRYDDGQQLGAFKAFVDASSRSTALAAAGRWPPTDLPLRDDLRSRLGWGLVFAMEPPSEGDMRSVFRREANRRALPLSDEVVDYLLTRFERDLKVLMGLLDRLDDFALATSRAITVPLLKQMLIEQKDHP